MAHQEGPVEDIAEITRQKIRRRFYKVLDYWSLFAYILAIYAGALLADALLYFLIKLALQSVISRSPLVSLWFDRLEMGAALLLIFAAFVHAIFSTYSQIKLDLSTIEEGTRHGGE